MPELDRSQSARSAPPTICSATGRTALKVSLGRYVNKTGVERLQPAINPLVTSVNDGEPHLDRHATRNYRSRIAISPTRPGTASAARIYNQNFGKVEHHHALCRRCAAAASARGNTVWDLTTRGAAPAVPEDVGHRRLLSELVGNFMATDNLEVVAADFSPYCVTAPVDAQLPAAEATRCAACTTCRRPSSAAATTW